MLHHQAPTIGGASTSSNEQAATTKERASAWNPYSILSPATRRKIDPRSTAPSRPYLESLNILPEVATERLTNKFLQLDPPQGKESDRRKAELSTRSQEKEKRKIGHLRKGSCGLVGKKRRSKLAKQVEERVSYETVLPMHHLWLGYMSELLALPLRIPNASTPGLSSTGQNPSSGSVLETSTLYPMYSSRSTEGSSTVSEPNINVTGIHTKLVKAEFVGSVLRVKRAKNPCLVGIRGLVLQETQATFKLVTADSKVKIIPKLGTILTISLPLMSSDSTVEQEISFDLFGDQFGYRSAERVGKKWKAGNSAGEVQL